MGTQVLQTGFDRPLKNVGEAGKTRRYVVTAFGWSKRRGSGVYVL
jgi:hypothetical protein